MKSLLEFNIRRTPIAPSSIAQTTALSKSLGAIDLAQGFPDDQPPGEILELFREAGGEMHAHQYSDPRGAPALRKNIAAKLAGSNGIVADPEREVVVTCGAAAALMAVFRALFEPGDHVLAFSPLYENYFYQAAATDLHLQIVALAEPCFAISMAALETAVSPRLRAVLLCNPCNPTGKVFSRDELSLIADFARRHNLIVIADETYERFVWQGSHTSFASLPGAGERTVTIFSMGKTYSVTGWRVGYVVAPPVLLQPILRMHQLTTIGAPHPLQVALARALELPGSFYANELARYRHRKETLMRTAIDFGLKPLEPEGGYFLWCDYTQISEETDLVFAERLIREAGVAGVPGQVFLPQSASNPRRIRFTFSKSLGTINEAARRLLSAQSNFCARVAVEV